MGISIQELNSSISNKTSIDENFLIYSWEDNMSKNDAAVKMTVNEFMPFINQPLGSS